MKNHKRIPALLSLVLLFSLMNGCLNPSFDVDDPQPELAPGNGMVLVSLSGANVQPSLGARTMLPQNPEFTRYELEFTSHTGREPYSFTNSSIQLQLPADTYTIIAKGYNGNIEVAKSGPQTFLVADGNIHFEDFKLEPYMGVATGVLNYSLSWDGLSRMPAKAELTIQYYRDHDGLPATDPVLEFLPPSLIPAEYTLSDSQGTILLLSQERALAQQAGSLSLSPGAYKLTVSVIMDKDGPAVKRSDAAHIYSNLTTPAVFHYGGGDLLLSNISPDSGTAFITGFTFSETPNATTVIGSQPGADGTRLIMIMVPDTDKDNSQVNLASLTPQVTCAPGSSIISPLPAVVLPDLSSGLPQPMYSQGEINFTNPTIWTAQARNGVTQRYTVVVSKAPNTSAEKRITYFFFKDHADSPGIIDEAAATIHVILPHGTGVNLLTPMISIIGKSVYRWDGSTDVAVGAYDFASAYTGGTAVNYRVYAGNGDSQDYAVTVDVALDTEREITQFAIDGYPGVVVTIDDDIDDIGPSEDGSITATLPYGVSLTNLTPLIQYRGIKLEPASGTARNFSAPAHYTVSAQNGTTKTYEVTLANDGPNTDTGIFDFVITQLTIKAIPAEAGSPPKPEVPAKTYTGNTPAKVVIGQKPRADGKIPIVIQVPYNTDEDNLIPAITLTGSTSTISPKGENSSASGVPIPFGNAGNPQEAVYTVTSQGGAASQDYVVLVSAGGRYLYVNGVTGTDGPDYYQGMSEALPYKTLAYAVNRAAGETGVDHIFVSGELTDFNQGGSDSGSVIALNAGTGSKKITVTGTGSGATFRGTSGKRVLSITGGADLVFENITVTGGNAPALSNGGGVYVSGNSKVKFSGGSITGNTALSGGGVYIEDSDPNSDSEFTLMGGSISGNAATGNGHALATMAGGGGVYVKGNALFWLVGGTVSNNTAERGAGGGVLVNGNPSHDPDPPGGPGDPHEDGFLMSSGTISDNRAPAGVYPHGGGGVYVARGAFEMLGGSITNNYSNRQGGGVFVHWGDGAHQPRFTASGNSFVTGNNGVGSSKGICNRGRTELMGNAQTDTAYVWDYGDTSIMDQSFILGENARIGGLVLAHSAENKNVLTIAAPVSNSDQICRIDLEGHLTGGGSLAPNDLSGDWVGKTLVTGDFASILSRLPLGTFTGNKTVYLTDYEINSSGKLVKK